MDLQALSLPEAAFLYMGLAVQALLRGTFRGVPAVLIAVMTLRLLGQGGLHADRRLFGRVLGYVATSGLILVLFWPEAVGRLAGTPATVDPQRVGSWVAAQDPGATVTTAAQTGLVPTALLGPQGFSPGLRLLLRALTETHLALARTLNAQLQRPFNTVMPMQWFLTQSLTAEAQTAVADWVHGCFLPAQAQLLARGSGPYTFPDLLPWGNSPMATELTTLETIPGAQSGTGATILAFLGRFFLGTIPTPLSCAGYLQQVEQQVQTWLGQQTTTRGTPLPQVFQQELGIPLADQARFLLYREMLRAAGPAIPAPSLTGTYLGLRGLGVLGSVLEGAGGKARIAGGVGSLGAGAIAGGVAGIGNEFQRAIDGAASLISVAVFLTWWGPYILGLVNLVLLGLFPIVILWALLPQQQLQPLALYVATLFFTTAMPLWWALVDLGARLAGATVPVANPVTAPGDWLQGLAASTVATALGIVIIPVATGILLFGSFRAISSVWRSGV